MKLFWFLAGSVIVAIAYPYCMYRSAAKQDGQVVRDKALAAAFMAGQPVEIHYDKRSLCATFFVSAVLFCALCATLLLVGADMRGIGNAGGARYPLLLCFVPVLLLLCLPMRDAFRRIWSAEPPLVLSADSLRINERNAIVKWPEIDSVRLEGSRGLCKIVLRFHERTFVNAFLIPRRLLSFRADYYLDSGALLECLERKVARASEGARAEPPPLAHRQDAPGDMH